jgi:hypothetical protein
MTVCTNDVALGDLVEDRLPVAVAEALSDAEALIAQMVELEHQRIALAAVDAGVLVEEADEEGDPFANDGLLPSLRVGEVSVAIRCVVLLLVLGSARSAVVVTLATCPPSPGIFGDGLGFAASSTSSSRRRVVRHEHMFAIGPDGTAI